MRRLVLAVALTAATVGAGCATSSVRIGDLLDDPGRYDGETVRVKGEVRESIGGFGRGAYRLDDGTGTLNVVNESGGAPREGARVGVEGTFRSVFTFGDRTEAVLMERDRFDP